MKCGKILPKEEESKTKCESSDNMSKDIHNIITEERIKKEAEKLMDTLPCDEPKGLVYNTFKYAVKWTMENL